MNRNPLLYLRALLQAEIQQHIGTKLDRISKEHDLLMAAIDDLKNAVATLGTSISTEIQAITDKLSALAAANEDGSVSAADAEDLVSQLTALKNTVDIETTSLKAGAIPPPAPAPAPPPEQPVVGPTV